MTRPASRRLLGLVVVPALALAVGACDEGNVHDLAVGDCFQDISVEEGDLVTDVDLVDCDEPHDNQVYGVFDLDESVLPGGEGAWPGDIAMVEVAEPRCAEAFAEYVGRAYEASELHAGLLTPSQGTWTQDDDREVVCYLYEPGARLEGSMEGVAR